MLKIRGARRSTHGRSSAALDVYKRQELNKLLRGKNQALVKELTHKMQELAQTEQFEEAQKIKNKIELIKEVTEEQYQLQPELILPDLTRKKQEEALINLRHIMHERGLVDLKYRFQRIEAYDVSNTQGNQATVSMVCFIDGLSLIHISEPTRPY